MRRILLILAIALGAFVAFEWVTFPNVAELKTSFPRATSFMEIRKRALRGEGKNDALLYNPVPYGSISPYLRRAVLVAEDDAFYEHGGVDVKALQEAIRRDWQRKKITHGGSTITQQLAKNLYLSPSRNPFRKGKEYILAQSLERNLSKKRILELYLNVAEFGERVYGAEAAARFYFHESASALSPQQAALLAGCLPNPRLMNPGSPNKRLHWRQRMILSRMRRWGYLFEQQVLTEKKTGAEDTQQPTDSDLTPPPSDTSAQPVPDAETSTSSTESAPAETSRPASDTAASPPTETTSTH